MSGHIDGTGKIVRIVKDANAIRFAIAASPANLCQIVEKGSVAVNGISLTVTAVGKTDFEVSVIPHTRDVTTLGRLRVSDPVNLETDMIEK